ncbi:hypothetical protein AX17_000715 [Amanita inopinata Kibby_2008]|nr:hypothetical protein AX17_000715 [Amanita inopinata Kibby_2008]
MLELSMDCPARKRQRLSFSAPEEPVDNLSQEKSAGFDALETGFSQSASSQLLRDQSGASNHSRGAVTAKDSVDDAENPFSALGSLPGSSFVRPLRGQGFKSASEIIHEGSQEHTFQSDNRLPVEPGYDAWFKPASDAHFVGFQTAAGAVSSIPSKPFALTFEPANVTFSTASNKGIFAPSKAALAAAQAKIEAIWNEDEETQSCPTVSSDQASVDVFSAAETTSSFRRPALQTLYNGFSPSKTPLPSSLHIKESNVTPLMSAMERMKAKGKAVDIQETESMVQGIDGQRSFLPSTLSSTPKPRHSERFVSPLMTPLTKEPAVTDSPIVSHDKSRPAFSSAATRLSAPQREFITPSKPKLAAGPSSLSINTHSALMSKGQRYKSAKQPFVTPFKSGVRSGSPLISPSLNRLPTSANMRQTQGTSLKFPTQNTTSDRDGYSRVFDLSPPPNRISLRSSGLRPQHHDAENLEFCGIQLLELRRIVPSVAPYYSFHTVSHTSGAQNVSGMLGPSAAFEELKRRGCKLATKPWVDNHWSLILWKLAGMVLLDPEQERDPNRRKWCWSEVLRQLLYRYERELNQGKRPALRKITAQDAPAALPMVLCISNIFWPEDERGSDGLAVDRAPELEVTDGWYRLRAKVDAPINRGINRGVIRVGRKIGVIGARLNSERKEPSEILEAYNTTRLVLTGNSSHLMPWHAKLGFLQGPFTSTLHSLTADGGCVAAMDIVITKVFPIAYLEFVGDGEVKRREGPRNGAEEFKLHEQWKGIREREAFKLRHELDKRLARLEGYIDRLQRRAGTNFHPDEDESPPDNIEDLYDALEDPVEANATITRLEPTEAGWLANHARASIHKEREAACDEIEKELQKICPPRDVRSFRVIVVQDARTRRRPANRVAQITVWDILNVFAGEDCKEAFNVGQRYLVSYQPKSTGSNILLEVGDQFGARTTVCLDEL